MNPYYADDRATVYAGDCLDVLRELPDNSVEAIVTDPPAGIGFMGKEWDHHKGGRDSWIAWLAERMTEALRVAKPGAHALVWAIPRTSHWTAMALEDAGWDVRDRVTHLFGTGFPKSLDVSKAIDRVNGEPDRLLRFTAWMRTTGLTSQQLDEVTGTNMGGHYLTAASQPAIPTRALWQLIRPLIVSVPAWVDGLVDRIEAEREVVGTRRDVATRIYDMGTGPRLPDEIDVTAPATDAARQWQGWGTALKPAAEDWWLCRKPLQGTVSGNVTTWGTGALNIDGCRIDAQGRPLIESRSESSVSTYGDGLNGSRHAGATDLGRWPAHVTLDEAAAELLDQMSGESGPSSRTARREYGAGIYGPSRQEGDAMGHADSGGASRFFYTAKAGSDERITHNGVSHPTVKPLALMRWLTRLITPPGGVVLDCFAGSGATIEAALLEGFRAIGIEAEPDYLPLITQRINRRRDPVAYLTQGGHDLGLFEEPA